MPISRPNDEQINIPEQRLLARRHALEAAAGRAGKLPAVVLVGGSGPTDRDGLAFGIPILGQLAGAIADAGFIVVRYDKRGIGQSGGRAESAALADYAEDVRAAVKLLTDRKDVDPQTHRASIGHSEGGVVALIAARRRTSGSPRSALRRAPGVTGADVVLAQQQRMLDRIDDVGGREAGEESTRRSASTKR